MALRGWARIRYGESEAPLGAVRRGFRAPKRSDRLGREHRSAENARRMIAVVELLPSLCAYPPYD
jgi:hypothetical protein